MTNKWKSDLIQLLKHLEKSYPEISKIHEFRRTLESCNSKKAEKLLPQLEIIYKDCQAHATEENFIQWFMNQEYRLTLGLKQIILVDKIHSETFIQHLLWTFSHFNPELDERPPEELKINSASILGSALGLPVSGKQVRQAMKRMGGMDKNKLKKMVDKVPKSKIESLTQREDAQDAISRLKEDPKARAIAEKIKSIQENK